jgi:hypothetical protein
VIAFQVGCAQSPAPGETVCGDAVRVLEAPGLLLVGVVDGLGHGPHAAEAAAVFCRGLDGRIDDPLERILEATGRALAPTRGAAAAVLRLDARSASGPGATLEFAGVGNIGLRVEGAAPVSAVCMPGILGRPVRRLRSFRFPLAPGTLLVLHSDGIASHFELAAADSDAASAARAVHDRHRKPFDDATCVVVRCLGGPVGPPSAHH